MNLETKKKIIIFISLLFLCSLVFVQWTELTRKRIEAKLIPPHISVPASSKECVSCHAKITPAIVDQWKESKHALSAVSCFECHEANKEDADGFSHYGKFIATVVTPKDCAKCHPIEAEEFQKSHHANAANILQSLDNYLAEKVQGSRIPFNPHSPTPGMDVKIVNGMASAFSGCQQCHGSKIALLATDGGMITVDDLKPDAKGRPTNKEALARIARNDDGKPIYHFSTWPNTGIGRLNLDGSKGSCSACHSRHDFSPRRARRPENCGKCHLGPDHPQKEIYEESKHGVAYRDLKEHMNLDSSSWVLGEDYSQAPTCATCHMSANLRNGKRVTHDPGERISWTNRPPISLLKDTGKNGEVVTEQDLEKRKALIVDSWQQKRNRMKDVCSHCHTKDYINAFYKQYDEFVILYNEKFAKPGKKIMDVLYEQKLISDTPFDEKIKWTWFYLWHHAGRRARHGASMMAPDYAQWHGMFEVAEKFYLELIPEAKKIALHAENEGKKEQAQAVNDVINAILSRPEHKWYLEVSDKQSQEIRKYMQKRYNQ